MAKKKIIHLIQSLDNGGCENMLLRTLPLLNDFEHLVVTLKTRGDLANQIEKMGIKVVSIEQKSLLDILAYFKLAREISRFNPRLIITYLFHADSIGRLFIQAISKTPVIPFLRTTYNHRKYWPPRLFEKLTKYFVKNYLANSESVKSFYTEKISVKKEKITIIPNGIDTNFYNKIARDENLRKSLGIKKEELAIICVANLHINKGHKYLLEAFEKVFCHSRADGNSALHLLLVGDGDEKESLLNQSKNYQSKDNILFLGKQNDVSRLLKISDIFVLPTLFEGMSNALMEAMACGLAIITTDIPENQELIENNKTGLLVPVKNINLINKALENLIEDKSLRNKLGNNAHIKLSKEFNLIKIVKKISKLYKSM